MGSVHSKEASVLKSPYVTAKHGLEGLAKVVAKEGAAYGVRSNVICPGFVRTPLVDKQIPEQAHDLGISEDDVVKKIMLTDRVYGEFTTVEDVARSRAMPLTKVMPIFALQPRTPGSPPPRRLRAVTNGDFDIPFKKGDPDFRDFNRSNSGSTIFNPMGAPLIGKPGIIYADCPAWMRKARAVILDTYGHPDLVQVLVKDHTVGDSRVAGPRRELLSRDLRDALRRAAERYDVDPAPVLALAGGDEA